ncbi:MAG: hypothetical protein RLZZ67_448 [Candidatus Parcubacteria bacterium]|jgi:uncharacterized membrane protein YkgB
MKKTEYTAFLIAHIALFIVFVWFGALKLFGLSPATPLVTDLFNGTLGLIFPITADTFVIVLGAIEVLIGLFFIIPKMEKIAFILLIPHMITTILPLFLLQQVMWTGFLVPTLEGQYVIKNVVIIALAVMVFADMHKKRKRAAIY